MRTRIQVVDAEALLGRDPQLPCLVVNQRTGELMKVVAYGPTWIDVVRCAVPVLRLWPPVLWGTPAWLAVVLDFTSGLGALVSLVVQIAAAVVFVRRLRLRERRWL